MLTSCGDALGFEQNSGFVTKFTIEFCPSTTASPCSGSDTMMVLLSDIIALVMVLDNRAYQSGGSPRKHLTNYGDLCHKEPNSKQPFCPLKHWFRLLLLTGL